jgi:hypothetical protein
MRAFFDVAELMEIFRASLTALVPIAERARIAWHGPNVYDPWEDIERALFASIVANALPFPPRPLPRYGITHHNYADQSFITDQAARFRSEHLVFLELTTTQDPFDTMCFLSVGPDFIPTGQTVRLPILQVSPELAARTSSGLSYLQAIEYDE